MPDIQNKPPAGYLIYHLSRISRRPDNTDSRMAAGDDTPDISHIPGPASRTCHRHVIDMSQTGRCFLRVPRRGARGRNKAVTARVGSETGRLETSAFRRGRVSRPGRGPAAAWRAGCHGILRENRGKTAGKPRFRRRKFPEIPVFRLFRAGVTARIRHMRGAGMRGRAADPAPGDKYRWKTNGCGIICRTTGFQTTWGGSPGPSRRSTRRCRR